MRVTILFDGACHPNPGRMGIGVLIVDDDGTPLKRVSEALEGTGTNNVAEYSAVIRGLEEAKALGATSVVVKGDSNLVVQQILGRFRVKQPHLKPLYAQLAKLSNDFDGFDIRWIPREQNKEADALARAPVEAAQGKRSPAVGSKPTARETSILCPTCKKPCELSLQTSKDGRELIRMECGDHGFVGFAPQTDAFRRLAAQSG